MRQFKRSRYIGDAAFYGRVMAIVVPIIIQNTITNVVSLLDNIMVGRVGTLPMSAVAIVNQLLFIFNLCIFGGLAGASIFSTQYAGARDMRGMRECMRAKAVIAAATVIVGTLILKGFSTPLIGLYISEQTGYVEMADTMGYSREYLNVMLWGLLPFAVTQVYASTLREAGETRLPMTASIMAIILNLILNYVLIFGKWGFPMLGVVGAGIATVAARYAEMMFIVVITHLRRTEYMFVQGVYKSLYISPELVRRIAVKGTPLLINEFLWSAGIAMLLQCYSVRGLNVVASANIASTISNLFNVVFLSMGSAVSIMVGQCLGSNEVEQAEQTVWQLITLSVGICLVFGSVMYFLAPQIPKMYNTSTEVKALATQFLRTVAILMPVFAFAHCCYFILRSGGRTVITMLFDCVFVWVCSVPVAYILSGHTSLNMSAVYFAVQGMDIMKCVFGYILVKKGVWIRNIIMS